jgi:hypothetical protein
LRLLDWPHVLDSLQLDQKTTINEQKPWPDDPAYFVDGSADGLTGEPVSIGELRVNAQSLVSKQIKQSTGQESRNGIK